MIDEIDEQTSRPADQRRDNPRPAARWIAPASVAAVVALVTLAVAATTATHRSMRPGSGVGQTTTTSSPTPTVAWADLPPTREGDNPNQALAGLTVAIDAPLEAVIGATLTYHVTVANPTGSTVSLTPCPSYQQLLTGGQYPVTIRHRLNCDGASEIPPRSERRFEMRLPVPQTAVGATQLQWFPGWGAPGGEAPIAVTPSGDDPGPVGCLPTSAPPPCGEGMTAGQSYLMTAFPHCGFRDLFADGRWWRPVAGTLEDNGNSPFGWGNPFDYGSAVLIAPDQLVYTASTGEDVAMRPARDDDPELPTCA